MRLAGSKPKGVRDIPKLPLIAFIDVVMFLLVFFMLSGRLESTESELAAAIMMDRRGKGSGSDLTPQLVEVRPGSGPLSTEFVIGGRTLPDRVSLTGVLRLLPKDSGVIIKVSPRASVQGAAAAVQAAHDSGFVKISYVPEG